MPIPSGSALSGERGISWMKGNTRLSLNTKLLMVQLGSLCLALLIFLIGITGGSWLLEKHYLSDEAMAAREREYVRELSRFITENQLSSTDTELLERWTAEKKHVYLAIYEGETPILETDGNETILPDVAAEALQPDSRGYYSLQFADGVFRVTLSEFSETPYYDLVVIFSLAAACLALLTVNLLYSRSVTRAVVRLSREVQWVEQGSRNAEIRSQRTDEIGDLARAVEWMRISIIQRMQSEQDAWAANSGLITAISHDIRTPLTALMGYLDLLQNGQFQDEAQMARYLGASREKARQLKELTDELFRYFLVFAAPEIKMNRESYDAVILMEQLLGDRVIMLQEAGFSVQTMHLRQDCTVELDVQYLQRVLDNVFTNVQKHADKGKRVTVMARLEENALKIDVANGVPDRPNPVESTKIGLQTCRKILREMGGSFETHVGEGKFLAEISLPCVKE